MSNALTCSSERGIVIASPAHNTFSLQESTTTQLTHFVHATTHIHELMCCLLNVCIKDITQY